MTSASSTSSQNAHRVRDHPIDHIPTITGVSPVPSSYHFRQNPNSRQNVLNAARRKRIPGASQVPAIATRPRQVC